MKWTSRLQPIEPGDDHWTLAFAGVEDGGGQSRPLGQRRRAAGRVGVGGGGPEFMLGGELGQRAALGVLAKAALVLTLRRHADVADNLSHGLDPFLWKGT